MFHYSFLFLYHVQDFFALDIISMLTCSILAIILFSIVPLIVAISFFLLLLSCNTMELISVFLFLMQNITFSLVLISEILRILAIISLIYTILSYSSYSFIIRVMLNSIDDKLIF